MGKLAVCAGGTVEQGKPTPWLRQRIWYELPPHQLLMSVAVHRAPDTAAVAFSTPLARGSLAFLRDHCISGRILLPGAAMFEMASAATTVASSVSKTCANKRCPIRSCVLSTLQCFAPPWEPVACCWCLRSYASTDCMGSMRHAPDGNLFVQGAEERRLLENVAIAVPLVMEPMDNRVLVCRLDARTGRTTIESVGSSSTRRAVHMAAQAGESQRRQH